MFDAVKPLRAAAAKKLLRAIISTGIVRFTGHALAELAHDGLTEGDALTVLRSGIVREAEWEQGEWRHRVEVTTIAVVVTFETDTAAVVITAWRKRQ